MRKLAEGYKRIRFLIEDGRDAETWTSTHVIAEVNSDGTILGRAFWPEYKAPARCFAEEPPPPPLAVDDVVMPEGVPAGCHNGDIGVVTREERAGVCHVKFNSREEVAFACLKLTRIGHLDRTK